MAHHPDFAEATGTESIRANNGQTVCMSALPLKADIRGAKTNVRYGPKADIGVVAETERPPRDGLSEIRSGAAIGPLNSQ
jgi:hypothetical protein